jgi:hypothetical protein
MPFRFAKKQMNVVRHQDIAKDIELVTATKFFEFAFEGETGKVVVEIRKTAITTEGDEVIAALGLVSLQGARHEDIVASFSRPRHPLPHPSAKCCVWMGHP